MIKDTPTAMHVTGVSPMSRMPTSLRHPDALAVMATAKRLLPEAANILMEFMQRDVKTLGLLMEQAIDEEMSVGQLLVFLADSAIDEALEEYDRQVQSRGTSDESTPGTTQEASPEEDGFDWLIATGAALVHFWGENRVPPARHLRRVLLPKIDSGWTRTDFPTSEEEARERRLIQKRVVELLAPEPSAGEARYLHEHIKARTYRWKGRRAIAVAAGLSPASVGRIESRIRTKTQHLEAASDEFARLMTQSGIRPAPTSASHAQSELTHEDV